MDVPAPKEQVTIESESDEVPVESSEGIISPPITSHELEPKVELEVITEEVPKEQVVKYIPEGNYKWSSIEIDTRNPQRPTLKLEVMIDGKPSYQYVNVFSFAWTELSFTSLAMRWSVPRSNCIHPLRWARLSRLT